MLAFSDTNQLFEAINILDYRPLDTLEAFAIGKGYESLLSDYIMPKISGHINNTTEIIEVNDYTVAAIENKDAALRIGDSIWLSFYKKKLSVLISIPGYTYSIHPWGQSSDCENQMMQNYTEGYFNDDWSNGFAGVSPFKIVSRKINTISFARSILKSEMRLYVKDNFSSSYVLLKAKHLNMRKDHWHIVKWKKARALHYNTIIDDIWVSNMGKKRKRLVYYYARENAIFPRPFCVPEFQRIHNWTIYYNKDLHNDTWY